MRTATPRVRWVPWIQNLGPCQFARSSAAARANTILTAWRQWWICKEDNVPVQRVDERLACCYIEAEEPREGSSSVEHGKSPSPVPPQCRGAHLLACCLGVRGPLDGTTAGPLVVGLAASCKGSARGTGSRRLQMQQGPGGRWWCLVVGADAAPPPLLVA